MSSIHDCIHEGEKQRLRVNYQGSEKILRACIACTEVIKQSNNCEILEYL